MILPTVKQYSCHLRLKARFEDHVQSFDDPAQSILYLGNKKRAEDRIFTPADYQF